VEDAVVAVKTDRTGEMNRPAGQISGAAVEGAAGKRESVACRRLDHVDSAEPAALVLEIAIGEPPRRGNGDATVGIGDKMT
jgi:hypothetical protein